MLPPYIFIQDIDDWQDCLADLKKATRIGVDLESNSMYVYREYICLIQVSTSEQDYIIDPLQGLDLSEFGSLLADPSVEKIFHAGEYDFMLMMREHGWQVNNLFDTMLAARVVGHKKIGLASLMDEIFDIELDKKYQRANWGERPLPQPQMAYAQRDTHYLFQLRDHLLDELAELGRLAEAEEMFFHQTRVKLNDQTFDPNGFWYLSGVKKLPRERLTILRALYILRDEIAKKLNKPLFKVIGNSQLMQMAHHPPISYDELSRVRGLSYQLVRREGRRILAAIREAQNEPIPQRPAGPKRPSEAIMNRFETLQTWRKHRALERGVESDVIVSKDAIWAMARQNPQSTADLEQLSDIIGPVRIKLYGSEMLSVLSTL